jgi:2-polyprenyl-3-methyl-5-hydroxy-6-metoxy-1,4-benzoquinol methylase
MAQPKARNDQQQRLVDELFATQATYWRDTYKEKDISDVIYQIRQAVALKYVDGLSLPKTVRVLEIGCGAGLMTAALAKRGFLVEAIDHSQAMVDLTIQHAEQTGIANQINVCTGDIHELSYENQTFDLIIALGVIPWLHDFQKALAEIARVITSSGYIVLTMDNALRATTLFDPKTFPPLAWIRSSIKRKLVKAKLLRSWNPWMNAPPYRQHTPKEFNRSLCEAGLTVMKSTSVGFGPFTFFGNRMFSNGVGIKIHQKLQQYANKEYPFFRSAGSQYIVLATKSHSNQFHKLQQ